MVNSFYLSTTIPYVNADPHLGHALEFVQSDAMVRFQRLLGKQVYFLSGSDENSLKNVQAAEKAGVPIEQFVEVHAQHFKDFKELLNISFDDFIRTTEKRHFDGAQELWRRTKKEDIYKKNYKGLYCVGCEAFYTPDELEAGLCPDHKTKPEQIEEENYFFRLSNYQKQLEQLIQSDRVRIVPDFRKNEVLSFIRQGLEDFSISRSFERAHGWGVPVPGDERQIMYVWYDALANYITALGYENESELYKKFWLQTGSQAREVVHVLGKGVSRFHAVYWLAMLLSADLPLPTLEFVHGYVTINGQKMSKSLGNYIEPVDAVKEFGCDAIRYYLLAGLSSFHDGDFANERLKELYNAHLANGIGNLVARVLTMVEKYCDSKVPKKCPDVFGLDAFWSKYQKTMSEYQFSEAALAISKLITECDGLITREKPWEKAKKGEDLAPVLYPLLEAIRHLALAFLPFIPEKAGQILSQLGIDSLKLEPLAAISGWGGLTEGTALIKSGVLFPRIA